MDSKKAAALQAINRIDALTNAVKQIAVNLLEIEKELNATQKEIHNIQEDNYD